MNKKAFLLAAVAFFGAFHAAYAGIPRVASHYLKATNFGFSIPAGATINGIQVDIEEKCSGSADCKDNSVKIVKGGTISGTELASAANWSTTLAYIPYGNASSLWGLSWTSSDINSSTFGVAISETALTQGAIASIDHIRISVTYTLAGLGPAPKFKLIGGFFRISGGSIRIQ